MTGDIIVFAPLAVQVQHVKRHLALSSLAFGEVINQIIVGQFVVLEGSPQLRYLFIEKADAIGFIGNLRLRLKEARRDKVSRLTSQDELYDLEITSEGQCCSLRDLAQSGEPTVHLNMASFARSVDTCAAGVFHTMLLLFPALASRKDIDQLRNLLGAGMR